MSTFEIIFMYLVIGIVAYGITYSLSFRHWLSAIVAIANVGAFHHAATTNDVIPIAILMGGLLLLNAINVLYQNWKSRH